MRTATKKLRSHWESAYARQRLIALASCKNYTCIRWRIWCAMQFVMGLFSHECHSLAWLGRERDEFCSAHVLATLYGWRRETLFPRAESQLCNPSLKPARLAQNFLSRRPFPGTVQELFSTDGSCLLSIWDVAQRSGCRFQRRQRMRSHSPHPQAKKPSAGNNRLRHLLKSSPPLETHHFAGLWSQEALRHLPPRPSVPES